MDDELDNRLIVMKFGGSSVANGNSIKGVSNVIKENIHKKPIIVLSAIEKITNILLNFSTQFSQYDHNKLEDNTKENPFTFSDAADKILNIHLEIAQELDIIDYVHEEFKSMALEISNIYHGIELLKEISDRTIDLILSYGERFSVRLLSAYLNKIGIQSKFFDSWDIGMKGKKNNYGELSTHLKSEVTDDSYEVIRNNLIGLQDNYEYTPVITGFIAKDEDNRIITFGRNGSDYSAVIIGVALSVKEIEIWKDVDGILSCDPKFVEYPKCIDCISYHEAFELAYFGAKVIHPMAIQPAVAACIPIRIRNTYNSKLSGTLISSSKTYKGSQLVTAITSKNNITVIDIQSTRMLGAYGFLSEVFSVFSSLKISVDVIATSEVSISLTIEECLTKSMIRNLEEKLRNIANISINFNRALISLIGNNKHSNEILYKTCYHLHLAKIPLEMVSYGASKYNISFVISNGDALEAVKLLHEVFFDMS